MTNDKSKDGYMTLEEHHAQLKGEGKWGEYQARHAQKEAERKKLWGEWNKAAEPFVKALKSVGIEVDTTDQLLDGRKLDPAAIPVILEHVKKTTYPDQIREMMLNALGSPVARPYWNEMVEVFEKNTANLSPAIRYVAALALVEMADKTVLDDVMRLVKERSLGRDRVPLLIALHRSKDPKAKMLLKELRDDPDLGPELKKMGRLSRLKGSDIVL